ncbi:MAG: hypothetical protein GY861_18480 [bacterium]|nr:hypothetical protein [bacterium]
MPTERQKRAVANLVENGRNVKSKGKALEDAGYSSNTAKAPTKVTESKGFKEIAEPIVNKMVKERDAVIERMACTRDKAAYGDLTRALSVLTEKIQLLKGESTENTEITFKWK